MPLRESKGDPPVRPNGDGPRTLAISFQRVQPKGRLVHILNPFHGIERREDQPQPIELISLEFSPIIMLKQELQALMPETLVNQPALPRICSSVLGELLSITLLYHLILADDRLYSFADHDWPR
jgi:hypothetical protein